MFYILGVGVGRLGYGEQTGTKL